MKKYFFIFNIICFIFFTSCFNNFTIPSKIDLSTSAKYNFTITDVDYSLSDYISPTSFISNSGDTNLFKIYDYNPNGNQTKQKYLIRMPIQEIPLDLSSYLGQTDFGNLINTMNFEQEVEIPSFSLNQSQDIDISVLNDSVNQLVTFGGTPTGSGAKQNIIFSEGFNSILYENGIIDLDTDAEGQVELWTGVDEAHLEKIASSQITNGKVSFNISGKRLYRGCSKISFQNAGSSFIARIRNNSKIQNADGLSFTNLEIPEIPFDFPFANANSPLESCTIDEGSIECSLVFPDDWDGITINQSINFTGGINLLLTSPTGSLNGKEITNNDIHATANYSLTFTNSYIDFTKSAKIKIGVDVDKVLLAVVKLPEGTNTSINVNQELPAEASSMITQIDWKAGCGIKIKYTNTFPEGNDFVLSDVESSFLGLEGQPSKSLEANKTNETVTFLTEETKSCPINSSTRIDFGANLILPGGVANKITVRNVVPGNKYKVKLEITPVLDWDKLFINSDLTNIHGDKDIDFNVTSIFSSLDEKLGCNFSNNIEFLELPVHIFSEIPNLSEFDNPSFNGKIKLQIVNSSGALIGSNKVYLLGSDSGTEIMPASKEPALSKNEKGVVISSVSGGLNANLAPIMNASSTYSDSKLSISYDIGLTTGSSSSLEISHDALNNMENTTIKIVAYVIIPLEFNLKDDMSIDIMGLVGSSIDRSNPNWDVLKRNEPTSIENISKFLEIIESVSISYNPTKKPFISSGDINLILDMDGNGTVFERNTLSLNGGRIKENPNNLLETFPLQPEVKLELKKGNIAVPRDIGIKSRIDLGINTNGKPISIWEAN